MRKERREAPAPALSLKDSGGGRGGQSGGGGERKGTCGEAEEAQKKHGRRTAISKTKTSLLTPTAEACQAPGAPGCFGGVDGGLQRGRGRATAAGKGAETPRQEN